MDKQRKPIELPSIKELEAELSRKKRAQNRHHLVRKLLYALLLLAVAVILVSVIYTPFRMLLGTWGLIGLGALVVISAILLCFIGKKRRKKW